MKRIFCHLASILIYNKSICTKSFNGLFTHPLSVFEYVIFDKKLLCWVDFTFFTFSFFSSPNNQTKESLIFPFPSFFFSPSVSWKKRGICRKMRNVWTIANFPESQKPVDLSFFSFLFLDEVDLSLNFVGLHGRWLPTFITSHFRMTNKIGNYHFVWTQWPVCCLESSKIYFRFHTETCMILQ